LTDWIPPKLQKRRLNADEKRARSAGELARFLAQYGRKAQRGEEPNDRRYSRNTEARFKRMKPEDLDDLIRNDEL